jgi:methyl-accepting chemotaxis protein
VGSEEQTRGMEQIARAVTQMGADDAGVCRRGAERAAAEELNAQPDSMKQVVERLTALVGGGSHAVAAPGRKMTHRSKPRNPSACPPPMPRTRTSFRRTTSAKTARFSAIAGPLPETVAALIGAARVSERSSRMEMRDLVAQPARWSLRPVLM